MDVFSAIAEPTRRQILAALVRASSGVNELAHVLSTSQPMMSKHLKVLREAGFVSRHGSAQRRIYQLEPVAFAELAVWLEPYRRMWNRQLDALERHLDKQHGRTRASDR